MKKHRARLVRVGILVGVLGLILAGAWLFGDKDGRSESQREPLGRPLTVKLASTKTPVTIAATEVRPVTAAEFADGGFERWEKVYSANLTGKRVWVVSFAIVRAGDGEIDPYSFGATKWAAVTDAGEQVRSSWPWQATLPCEPANVWADPGLTSCAFLIVPEGDVVVEVQFTGVDRSSSSPRQIGPIERYVSWTID